MRVSALTFACYSAACAPPPVGKGGSNALGTRKHDKAIRSSNESVRKAAEQALADAVHAGTAKIYHGSQSDIAVGDIIKPSDSPGAKHIGLGTAAFATRNIVEAGGYAGQGGKVYEVSPIEPELHFLPNPHGGIHVASPSGFKVTAVHSDSYQYPTKGGNKASRYKQRDLAKARKERAAKVKMDNDPAFADAIRRLEAVLR